ncbi:MAG: T9SS type A sorting domain-containing protein [Bacteroidota bacterium]
MTIKKVEPTSVAENDKNKDYKIMVYLNSNLNEISFNTKGENVELSAIRIFDISGKVYFDKSYSGIQNLEQLRIPANTYPSGAYILQLIGYEGKINTLKIVIE